MDRSRRLIACLVAAAVTVGFALLLADDVPASDRDEAWLGFLLAAIVCFPLGYAVRWGDRRLRASGAVGEGWPVIQLAVIVLAVLAGAVLQRAVDARYLMMIEGAAGALFIALVVTNR